MRTFFSVLLLHCSILSIAQKQNDFEHPIDSALLANWHTLSDKVKITDNGNYFMYLLQNVPRHSQTIIVQSTENGWRKEFAGAEDNFFFSADSKLAVIKANDTLFLLSVGTQKIQFITNVSSFKQPINKYGNPSDGTGKLIIYKLNNAANELVVRDLLTSREKRFNAVIDYLVNGTGTALLLKCIEGNNEVLKFVNLVENTISIIWSAREFRNSSSVRSYQFDKGGEQAVFLVQDKNNPLGNSIWFYRQGILKSELKVDSMNICGNDKLFVSNSTPLFSVTGNYIFFDLHEEPKSEKLKRSPQTIQVDVWNYKDLWLQYSQLKNLKDEDATTRIQYRAVVPTNGTSIIRLENKDEVIVGGNNGENDLIITGTKSANSGKNYNGDKTWKNYESIPKDIFLVDLKDGSKRVLTTTKRFITNYTFSPTGKYLVYFDHEQKSYFSYELKTGKVLNVSKSIPSRLTNEDYDERTRNNTMAVGLAGWLGKEQLLVYDNADIWKISLTGKNNVENLTKGYGHANNIRFKIIHSNSNKNYSLNKHLLLSAFNIYNKKNGFFSVVPSKMENPQLLSLDSYLFYTTGDQTLGHDIGGFSPVKAKGVNKWIVKRQSANDAPNYFITDNFKSFTRLTNYQPQRKYNWLNTELLTWKQSDKRTCQGILYKPENFDPTKQYPVIITYYEHRSSALNKFLFPDYSDGNINIPWFVSKGYLIFDTDIHFTLGKAAQGISNSVLSGVKELTKLSYVDSAKIAIQGQSFGGYETYVLVTSSNLFSAAVSTAGISDLISQYGSLLQYPQMPYQHLEHHGQLRIEATMWENLKAYIENSPILNVHKVTTPLLIRHNKGDETVPWEQSVEFFIGMRRLDKPCWMLQYDEGGHGVHGKDAIDFTKRLEQFYNHYLKHAPAPVWMTQGIPAMLKGVITGYDYDPSNNCGKDCKVCKTWNEKMKKDSTGTWKEIEGRKAEEHWQ